MTDIERLAQRIEKNGYELTRALWAYPNNGHYEVFAGGNRLEAVKRTSIDTVPVILHEGFSEDEITHLADEDNENDEYHAPVPIVDVWLDYKRLADAGWTQQRIAKAKGTTVSRVTERVQYAGFPSGVLSLFFQKDFLKESHAAEINRISNLESFSSWLDRETAMLEVIDDVLRVAKKNKELPTAKDFTQRVKVYNDLIAYVQSAADELQPIILYDARREFSAYEYNARQEFLGRLATKKVRTKRDAQIVTSEIKNFIADNLQEYQEHIDRQSKVALKIAEAARVPELPYTIHLADLRNITPEQIADNSIDLIFTDPPYDEKTIPRYGDLARLAVRILKPGGSLITYAGHYALPQIFEQMCPHLRYWWIISLNHSGNSARLPGKWVFVEWKPLLWFVKEERRDDRYVADRIQSEQPDKQLHEWQQDVSEAIYYIQHLTVPGEIICDPFMGSATTGIAAIRQHRKFVGIEIDEDRFRTAQE